MILSLSSLTYRQFLEALPNTVVCRIGSTAVAFFPAPLNILTYSEDRIFYSLLRILRYVASAGWSISREA
jgi:hypothetical protein